MALSPEVSFEDIEDDSDVIETSKTYKIDFETGRMTGDMISGLEAVEQNGLYGAENRALRIRRLQP